MTVVYRCDRCKEIINEMITVITIDNYFSHKIEYHFCNKCRIIIENKIREKI